MTSRSATWVFLAHVVLVSAAPSILSLHMRQDTVLPLEPAYATVVVRNLSSEVMPIPEVREGGMELAFSCVVYSSDGKRVDRIPLVLVNPPKRWADTTLAPGDSLCAVFDPAARAFLQPGVHSISLTWSPYLAGQVPIWGHDSARVSFIVREPNARERGALEAYRKLSYYESGAYLGNTARQQTGFEVFTRDRWSKVDSLARSLMAEYQVEPYVVFARLSLHHVFVGRSGAAKKEREAGESQDQWRDSVCQSYKAVLTRYPDSPIAEHLLYYSRFSSDLDRFAGQEANVVFLQQLAKGLPATLVGREAERQLLARRSRK